MPNFEAHKSIDSPVLIFLIGFKAAIYLLIFSMTACATVERIEPDETSYPRDRSITRTNIMVFTPTYLLGSKMSLEGAEAIAARQSQTAWKPTVEWEETVIGDTAELETYVIPRDASEASETALFSRSEQIGEELCNGDFRVVRSRYFYGSEATLQMHDIYTPALRVVFRYPLGFENELEGAQARLQSLSTVFDDNDFFDISSAAYELDTSKFVELFRAFLIARGMPIHEDHATSTGRFFAAGIEPDSRRYGLLDRVTALIEEKEGSSVFTFKLFAYQIAEHRRGVTATAQPGFAYGARPWDRRVSYERAKIFLGELKVFLEENPLS